MSAVEITQVVERTWRADPMALRRDFGHDLRNDAVDVTSDTDVVEACWNEGVREPYFELQDEFKTDLCLTTRASAA